MNKFKRSAKIFLMATAMISNFFAIGNASASTPPDPTPPNYTTSDGINYSLNYTYVPSTRMTLSTEVTVVNGSDPLGAIGIKITGLTDELMLYRVKNKNGSPIIGVDAGLTATIDGAEKVLNNTNYKFYKFCSNDSGIDYHADGEGVIGTKTLRVCGNDVFNSSYTFVTDANTFKLVYLLSGGTPPLGAANYSPLNPANVVKGEIVDKAGNETTYAKEVGNITKVIKSIATKLQNSSRAMMPVALAVNPTQDLAAAEKITNPAIKKTYLTIAFEKYFNACDVNDKSEIKLGGSRGAVIATPSPSNRPYVMVKSGNVLKAEMDANGNSGQVVYNKCKPDLTTNIFYRPETKWLLDKTAKTGMVEDDNLASSNTIYRATFYFQMAELNISSTDANTVKAYKDLNILRKYFFICLQLSTFGLYADYTYGDVGFDTDNIVKKGVVARQQQCDAEKPICKTFSENIVQFTFNQNGMISFDRGERGAICKNLITVLPTSTVTKGVTVGINKNLGIDRGVHDCYIDPSPRIDMIVEGSAIKFSQSINDIQKEDLPGLQQYRGYLSAWGVKSYNSDGNLFSYTVTTNSTAANTAANDDSCGCGDVTNSNIMNLIKRSFCAVICWTFNVGKGLQQNATCLFN
ncbi:MAG: hypothetical protein WCI79_03510, partial [Candidatus Saccharibacteria bacterium]